MGPLLFMLIMKQMKWNYSCLIPNIFAVHGDVPVQKGAGRRFLNKW